MGMFDTVFISTDQLPINEEQKDYLGDLADFQTKDLDCNLDSIYIINGYMKIYKYDEEKGVEGEKLSYTGKLNFYSIIEGKPSPFNTSWIEFRGEFINGKMISINQVK